MQSKALVLKKFVPWILVSAILSFFGMTFFATPVLRVLRNVFGGRLFWFAGAFLLVAMTAAQLMPFAFMVSALWILVGVYSELELRGRSGFWTGLLSVSLSFAWIFLGHRISVKYFGIDALPQIKSSMEEFLTQAGAGKTDATSWTGLKVDSDLLMMHLPGGLLILQIINLAFALSLDVKVSRWMTLPYDRIVSHWRLLEFKVPDGLVWLAMASFLGTFLKAKLPGVNIAASNLFSVMMAVYFFQGLAILETSFLSFKTGPLFRFLIYVTVVGQLFFVLSAVGFVDYWLDFRKRLKKLRLNINNRKHGEQL
jgi:hypothetical protein